MYRILLLLFVLLTASGATADTISVAPGGSLHEALRQAREWRRTNDPRCKGGITIHISAGRYYMDEPLFIRPEDSGTPTSPLTIEGEGGTVLCGDAPQRHTQLFPKEGMERIIGFDAGRRTITIPTPPRRVLKQKNLEMVVHQRWAMAILRVKDMKVRGKQTEVSFLEPESRLEFEHPWPQPVVGGEKGNSSFLLRTTEQRDGIEQLVVVQGTEEHPIKNVALFNLSFENTTWNRPLHKGHVTLQGGFPIIDAYKLKEKEGLPWDTGLENQAWIERPVAAVSVSHASHVVVRRCRFCHLAATALDFVDDIHDCDVSKCIFEHIGGTAIMGGSFAESPREVHRPYDNLAARCQRLAIIDNRIVDATTEDWGAVAISLGYVSACTIARNEISKVNYSGICVGWGWTPMKTGMEANYIIANKVYDYARQLYDAGGIYTLSNQPYSHISHNEIGSPYPAPYATNDRGFRIYLDARTDGYTLKDNITKDHEESVGRPIRRDEIGENNIGPDMKFIIGSTTTPAVE
ncbi:MAG: right-handed parallel beta-helix repeat-containing protein [Prevotella sp.]|nr:right-handed parallel beta-helix repeat-containing protein [Prevotella sp.]